MGEIVEFPSNGHTDRGYLAVPESGAGPGVIVIQEWWGLVPHIVDVVDRFAAAGFTALAPDLYTNAKLAFAAADEAARDDHDRKAEDLRTEGRLWLAAAVTEAERVQLDQKRLELQEQEEKWGQQLARDRAATEELAREIALQEARALALEEAERLSAARREETGSAELFDALMFRLRTELAVARAFGAPEAELNALEQERAELQRSSRKSARAAEALLAEASALVGRMRATAASPGPGASTELVQTAQISGFEADQDATGTVVRSDRFVSASGNVSTDKLGRMRALLEAFPHGPWPGGQLFLHVAGRGCRSTGFCQFRHLARTVYPL